MGWSQRYFRWEGQDWVRVQVRWMDRFVEGAVCVEGGGDALETASITLELEDRVPVRITRPRFDRWPLLPDGTIDREKVMRGTMHAMESLFGPGLLTRPEGAVVHAESRFAHRRHQAESQWIPTVRQLALLVPALMKAGVTAALAQRILEVPRAPRST